MIQNDSTVGENYQRLVSETLLKVFEKKYDDVEVKSLREELIGKIREPLHRLFPDLLLTGIGMVTEKADFYFNKGIAKHYGYEKLSGGEKAAFALLLDMVIKSEYYKNTVFCIDEPETHIHTKLQAALLSELFALIPEESQMWIATHSFGMLKEAKKLLKEHPDEVIFLNFDGYDFDDRVHIFIFKNKYPNTIFYSLGSCNDIQEKNTIIDFITKISPKSKVIRLIDRDDRSAEEIVDANADGIRVLGRRHIECYLLDDNVLKKWCIEAGKPDKTEVVLELKQNQVNNSIQRGNPVDDIKSASNDICTLSKKELGIPHCGNSGQAIMRDTLSKLITQDMTVYEELEHIIENIKPPAMLGRME